MSSDPDASPPPTWGPLRSFGRIKSRTLKPRQAALFDSLLPAIALPDMQPFIQAAEKGEGAKWLREHQ